jgi:hypothetical protein
MKFRVKLELPERRDTMKILYVEDNPHDTNLLQRELARQAPGITVGLFPAWPERPRDDKENAAGIRPGSSGSAGYRTG